MFVYRSFFLTLFILITALGFSEIRTIHSFKEAEKELNNVDANSLVLFDVDEVLIRPADALLTPSGGTFAGWEKVPKEQFDDFLSIMIGATQYTLVDPDAPQVVADLKKRGVPTLGFTACRTGAFATIPSMENWRFKQLNQLGIDFSPSFTKECSFPELVGENVNPPLCKKGILFCGDFYIPKKSSKGLLLDAFLDRFKLHPSKVVFFDDDLKNLVAVEEILQKREIPYQGLLLQKDFPALDEKIAELQLQTLLEKKKWISDLQAKELL